MKHTYILFVFLLAALFARSQPYPVGTMTVIYTDSSRSNRQVTADIYFPALTSGGSVLANDSFPFVVFGHGFQMQTVDYTPFVDSLIPRGYILAFSNTENSLQPSHPDFAKDLTFIYNKLISEHTNAASPFYQHVIARGAIGGHSMGGGCTLLSIQYSEPALCYFGFAEANTNPSAQTASTHMTRPYLSFAGSEDCIAPYGVHQKPTYDSCASPCKVLIEITGASHCQFDASNSICNLGETVSGCANPPMSRTDQINMVMGYLQPYLDHHLKGLSSASASFDSVYIADNVNTKATNCAGLPNGIENLSAQGISVYPNPANGVLYIKSDQEVSEVKLIDQLGQQIVSVNAPDGKINVTAISAGIYTIEVITRNGQSSFFKIVRE
ncbi:MAG: hypothetical protein JWO03_2034 [Bacteroidetes bacterium]|nr:hypothetical protein [Bacteroidota bacterium]